MTQAFGDFLLLPEKTFFFSGILFQTSRDVLHPVRDVKPTQHFCVLFVFLSPVSL